MAVIVSGGDEGRLHGGEGELAFHGVHDLVRRVSGGGSARGRHPRAAIGGGGVRGRELGGIGRGNEMKQQEPICFI